MPDDNDYYSINSTELDRLRFIELARSQTNVIVFPSSGENRINFKIDLSPDKNIVLENITFVGLSFENETTLSIFTASRCTFVNCEFPRSITITSSAHMPPHSELETSEFKGCIFSHRVDLNVYKKGVQLIFNHCKFKEGLSLGNGPISGRAGEIQLNHGHLKRLSIVSSTIEQNLLFESGRNLIRLEDLTLSGTKLENIGGLEYAEIGSSDRESMRKLKSHALANHDRILSGEYYKREMEYLYEELKKRSGYFWDSKILQLNDISNKHGTDWVRGIRFTLTGMAFIFILCLSSLDSLPFGFGWVSFEEQLKAISAGSMLFAEFLIPTHKLDMWEKLGPNGLTYLLDLFSRLYVGYGIYQTLSAFRRFSSK